MTVPKFSAMSAASPFGETSAENRRMEAATDIVHEHVHRADFGAPTTTAKKSLHGVGVAHVEHLGDGPG